MQVIKARPNCVDMPPLSYREEERQLKEFFSQFTHQNGKMSEIALLWLGDFLIINNPIATETVESIFFVTLLYLLCLILYISSVKTRKTPKE